MKHYVSAVFVGLITLLSNIPTAHAAFIQNNFGLSDPSSTITFDERILPNLTRVTTEYSDLGVTFSPYGFYFDVANNGLSGIANFVPFGSVAFPLNINFTTPQTEVAFAFTSADGSTTFQAFLGGNLVESYSNIATGIESFYGFRDITFDSIIFATTGSGVSCSSGTCPEIVDNIQFSTRVKPVPSPSGILGIALASLGFGVVLRRKLAKANMKKLAI